MLNGIIFFYCQNFAIQQFFSLDNPTFRAPTRILKTGVPEGPRALFAKKWESLHTKEYSFLKKRSPSTKNGSSGLQISSFVQYTWGGPLFKLRGHRSLFPKNIVLISLTINSVKAQMK